MACSHEVVTRKVYRTKESWACKECGLPFISATGFREVGTAGTAPGGETPIHWRVAGLGTFQREDMANYVLELMRRNDLAKHRESMRRYRKSGKEKEA